MPLVEITVTMTIDGQPVDGFPIIRRLTPAEETHKRIQKPNGDGSSYYAASSLTVDNVIIFQTDAILNLRLNGQTTSQISLNAGGLFILVDGIINAGQAENILVNNQGTTLANLLVIEVGP